MLIRLFLFLPILIVARCDEAAQNNSVKFGIRRDAVYSDRALNPTPGSLAKLSFSFVHYLNNKIQQGAKLTQGFLKQYDEFRGSSQTNPLNLSLQPNEFFANTSLSSSLDPSLVKNTSFFETRNKSQHFTGSSFNQQPSFVEVINFGLRHDKQNSSKPIVQLKHGIFESSLNARNNMSDINFKSFTKRAKEANDTHLEAQNISKETELPLKKESSRSSSLWHDTQGGIQHFMQGITKLKLPFSTTWGRRYLEEWNQKEGLPSWFSMNKSAHQQSQHSHMPISVTSNKKPFEFHLIQEKLVSDIRFKAKQLKEQIDQDREEMSAGRKRFTGVLSDSSFENKGLFKKRIALSNLNHLKKSFLHLYNKTRDNSSDLGGIPVNQNRRSSLLSEFLNGTLELTSTSAKKEYPEISAIYSPNPMEIGSKKMDFSQGFGSSNISSLRNSQAPALIGTTSGRRSDATVPFNDVSEPISNERSLLIKKLVSQADGNDETERFKHRKHFKTLPDAIKQDTTHSRHNIGLGDNRSSEGLVSENNPRRSSSRPSLKNSVLAQFTNHSVLRRPQFMNHVAQKVNRACGSLRHHTDKLQAYFNFHKRDANTQTIEKKTGSVAGNVKNLLHKITFTRASDKPSSHDVPGEQLTDVEKINLVNELEGIPGIDSMEHKKLKNLYYNQSLRTLRQLSVAQSDWKPNEAKLMKQLLRHFSTPSNETSNESILNYVNPQYNPTFADLSKSFCKIIPEVVYSKTENPLSASKCEILCLRSKRCISHQYKANEMRCILYKLSDDCLHQLPEKSLETSSENTSTGLEQQGNSQQSHTSRILGALKRPGFWYDKQFLQNIKEKAIKNTPHELKNGLKDATQKAVKLYKKVTTYMAAGNNVLDMWNLKNIKDVNLPQLTVVQNIKKNVKGGVPIGVKNKASQLVAEPVGVREPDVTCFHQGMRCCVPQESVRRWSLTPPLLGGQSKPQCKADYIPRLNMYCTTIFYDNKECNLAVVAFQDTIMYRTTMVSPHRHMNDAICECLVRKPSSDINGQLAKLTVTEKAHWLYSKNYQAQQQASMGRVESVGKLLHQGADLGNKMSALVSKFVDEPIPQERLERANHFVHSIIGAGEKVLNATSIPPLLSSKMNRPVGQNEKHILYILRNRNRG